ncbi:MAG: hypothetical protein K0S09_1144 [Sphingobacteriaceae bacterium]|nr:hypothetical protein [Sphingobacteriaceae bacterium]
MVFLCKQLRLYILRVLSADLVDVSAILHFLERNYD